MSRSTNDLPIIAVGGGLAGLATTLALGQQGRKVRLLEQSAEITAIGYGVQIGPNVLPVLDRLGLGQATREAAFYPDDLQLLDAYSGEQLFRIPLRTDAFRARYPAPYIAIHRVDLHEILLKACRALPNVDLNQATTVTGFSQTEDVVRVETSAGIVEGSALIAADGLRSRLRTQLLPQDTWRDTGYVAHRTIVRSSDAPASMRERTGVTMYTGEDFHVIFYPLRGATEINIVGVFKVPADAGSEDSAVYRDRVGRMIARARPQVHDVVSVLNLERRWSIADRNPLRGWCQGRVTLIGDSAHATLQSLAQGAGMALEDALALSRCMAECSADPAQAFRRFERDRFVRTARVVLESRSLWHTYHCGDIDAQVRDQQLQERTPEDYYRCLDWLWNPQPSLAS
jgi:salicylate hydroxylase